ncbi:hypothetical protein [Streptomyces acidiscabies]|uniref:hypothetical protein n=1 Tax=Streptomyces acidiscabies TaxID=42234 RepID=UPI001CBE6E3C|nr:hypothetical protein [Streptomyces acidiscabies]MBZ3909411.1 hypothetical protein [Streptomyces acidiscabies]
MSKASEEAEEPSRASGACALAVLGGVVVAVAFAIDEAAGVLFVVTAGTAALWRSARRMSDSSATPPPQKGRPTCRECAGHTLLGVTPLEGQKGMSIYTSAPPDRPSYTHVHIAEGVTD